MNTNDLKEGELLKYTGKGFYGFVESNRSMTFVKQNHKSLFTVWVKYLGNNMLINKNEIELIRKPKL